MPQCAIPSCTNSQRRTQDQQKKSVRYHRFPSDATTRSKWIRACGKQSVNVDSARVCSLHFSPISYKSDKVLNSYASKKCIYKSRLKKGVIPHLFLQFNNKNNAKIAPKRKHYNLTTRQRFNNTLCAIKNSVQVNKKRVIEVDDFVESVWSDSEFPVLYAVGLRPVKGSKTCVTDNNTNGNSKPDQELLQENDTMLVMEESTETTDNIGSTPPRIENPIETSPEPTKIESKPQSPSPTPEKKIEEEPQTNEEGSSQTEIKTEEVKIEESKTDDEVEKVIELDDSDLIELDEEDVIEKTETEEPEPKKIKLDETDEAKCLTQITELDELIKLKEREWNQLIVAKKMKEIELLRIQRKKQIIGITKKPDVDWEHALDQHLKSLSKTNESAVTILPIPSTSASPRTDRLRHFRPDNRSLLNKPRTILPKNTSIFMECQNGATLSALKTGPKGQPMMDVNLIVEKFRQSNPDVPRRGKRIRSVLRSNQEDAMVSSTSRMLPMISMRPGARTIRSNEPKSELGLLLSGDQGRGRDSQNDSSRSSADSEIGAPISANVSFKDALVEFARLSQQQTPAGRSSTGIILQNPGSNNSTLSIKPISSQHCPEVTLHPVLESLNSQTSSPKSSNSLLHGILTKTKPKNQPKTFTTLSPTLARLLTDTSSQPSDVSNINDLLAVNQSRLLEATSPQRFGDAPIDATTRRPANVQFSNSPVVNVDDMDNDDSLDRLIIDESADAAPNTSKQKQNKSDTTPSEVLHCQGCNKNSAQFVCAGCTNQWYCSRECQVQDWDRHCETCLG